MPGLAAKEVAQFAAVTDIPFPQVALADLADPIPEILGASEFTETKRYFVTAPSATRSLLSDTAQALLYAIIRNLRPDHVVEIGTYQGGTAETLSRGLQANGHGMLHTVSPFDAERFGPTFAQWPEALQRHAQYYPLDSMAFFMQLSAQHIRPGLVLVDGNHDIEFAAFDIASAARCITPGGFIFVDNISQAGPYQAGLEFLAAHPDWRDCGKPRGAPDNTKAFDYRRTRIAGADLFVLRAPFGYHVSGIPRTFGEIGWHGLDVSGLTVAPARPGQIGMLKVQCILRAFSEQRVVEIVTEADCVLDGGTAPFAVKFQKTWQIEQGFDRYAVEPWLCWLGEQPLELTSAPTPF